MNELPDDPLNGHKALEELISRPPPSDDRLLRVWTVRIHEDVAREIENLARLKRMSVNAYVVFLFDRILRENGRPSVAELAPEFVAYLQRRGGTKTPRTTRLSSEFGFSDE